MSALRPSDFDAALLAALDGVRPARIGLAVSGGGDSMAMLDLAVRAGWQVFVATVDHGLRPEAAQEAELVARHAERLGVAHDVLHWQDWDGQGNLQARAREARRALLREWAARRGLHHIALAHTADDQAETVLMEIGRKAGPAGQAGMAPRRDEGGISWLRPLLGVSRQALRDYLREAGISWADDPSNDDLRYARVRARQALAAQPDSRAALIRLGQRQRQRDHAARRAAHQLALDAELDRGELRLLTKALSALPDDARHVFLREVLIWLGNGHPGPRGSALRGFDDRLSTGEGGPLHGVIAQVRRGQLILCRDASALDSAPLGPLWDGRWRLTVPTGMDVGPLGEDVGCYANRRDLGLTRRALMASPALRRDGDLISAPLLDGGTAEYCPSTSDLAATILSH